MGNTRVKKELLQFHLHLHSKYLHLVNCNKMKSKNPASLKHRAVL